MDRYDGWMDRQMDGLIDIYDGWMDRWVDE